MFTVTVSDSSGNPVFSMSDQRLTFPTNSTILGQALDATNAALGALTVRAEVPPPSQDQIVTLFTQLSGKIDTINQRMVTMSDTMSQLQTAFTGMEQRVTEQTNVVDSTKTLLVQLTNTVSTLRDGLANTQGVPQALVDQANAIVGHLQQNTQGLADAVAANTPAAPAGGAGGGTPAPAPAPTPPTDTTGGGAAAPPTDTTGGAGGGTAPPGTDTTGGGAAPAPAAGGPPGSQGAAAPRP